MIHLHRFIFCMIFISNTLLTQTPKTPEEQYNSHSKQNPQPKTISHTEGFEDSFSQLGEALGIYENTKSSDPSEFHDNNIAELEMVFESSPEEAQQIVHYLKNNKSYKKKCGYMFFVGKPGVGKTTMAKAIAYKMSLEGWDCKHFTSSDFIKSHRNETAIYLKQQLESAAFSHRPTIVIIDEINGLLENAHSENHDTNVISNLLCSFLDRQNDNPRFFLIGTANDISKLPQAMKSRLLGRIVIFPVTTSTESRIKSLYTNQYNVPNS